MYRATLPLLSALTGLVLSAGTAGAQMKTKVLWLGGGGGSHDPAAMRDVLKPIFEKAGMEVDYKTHETVLHADSLARYDVLYVYNAKKGKAVDGTPDLTPAQEDALYAWVRAGHAVIGVHSANSSYLANPRYLDLFGASFANHGDTEAYRYISIVNAGHPSMAGVSPPPAAGNAAYWDEGRVGKFTKTDTLMLARARASGKLQPWTWVRPEGKGWVYYTSSGHDQRVWNDVNFQKQLVQALSWGASLNQSTALLQGRERSPSGAPGFLFRSGSIRYFSVTGAAMVPAASSEGGCSGLASGFYPGKESSHARK